VTVSDLLRLIGQNQRFKAAPRVGHAEQAEVVEILCQLDFSGTLIRLHIGLENVDDLQADLAAGFARIV
jgi:cystathionine beta-lyase